MTRNCPLNHYRPGRHYTTPLFEILAYHVGDIVSMTSGEVADPEDVDILRTSLSPLCVVAGGGGGGCETAAASAAEAVAAVAPRVQLSCM